MRSIETFHAAAFLDTVVSLVAAFLLGTLIGAERQYRQRTAGLRTNVLVALGAAAFVDLGMSIAGSAEAVRVISYVVSGIGFLGAGVIMKEGMNVRGLNTAATLWCSGAVGCCAGADMLAEATLLTVMVIGGNTLLRPLVNAINRIPINAHATEMHYAVRLTVATAAVPELRERLVEELEAAHYPVSAVDLVERGDEQTELVASLVSSAAHPDELDAVIARLQRTDEVVHGTWKPAPAIEAGSGAAARPHAPRGCNTVVGSRNTALQAMAARMHGATHPGLLYDGGPLSAADAGRQRSLADDSILFPRRALVTGGSGDLGGAICRALAAQGLHVIVHANANVARAAAVVEAIVAAGGSAEAVAFDVADAEASAQALATLLEAGPIQVLVNNAGIHDDAPMAGMSAAQWHKVIDVSLHGFFHVTQPLLLPMARTRWGRIVSVSSVAAVLGNRGQTNYAAAKAALHGASMSLAREMASRGISVNVVAPGVIQGAMADSAFRPEAIKQMVPAGRPGKPEEVAALVAFLCSDAAAYINGQVIGINGGMG